MSNSKKATAVRSQNGKVSTQAEKVLPLTETVKGKPDAAEKLRIAQDVAAVSIQLAELIRADETGAFTRAKIAYQAVERELTLSAIASGVGRALARQDAGTDASEEVIDALAASYVVTKATVSRWADSYGYAVRADIVPNERLVAAIYRLLNHNSGDPATALTDMGAKAKGDADAFLAALMDYQSGVPAAKKAAREAKAALSASAEVEGEGDESEQVPASAEVVVQSVVESLSLATAMRADLTIEQLAAVSDAVTAWIAATAPVTA